MIKRSGVCVIFAVTEADVGVMRSEPGQLMAEEFPYLLSDGIASIHPSCSSQRRGSDWLEMPVVFCVLCVFWFCYVVIVPFGLI